ncbi:MAG: hypothetical protein VXZ36_01620 [Pseudomonadota bacterium]|jgi:TPR repeat protein|uniref:hypothetical protein n=1 Tax=unclassified Alteromonas TaxID=2614992 RepID=UPI002EBF0059|nr:hypothetical protein [Pseudomonadota bacterium]MEC8416494.1 hypothetical protein [Pseudomonadota bacterium]
MKKHFIAATAALCLATSGAAYAQQKQTIDGMWQSEYLLIAEQGMRALHAKDYERALEKLTESAKLGNKEAQYYLAQMYFQGWGVPINYEEGWLWMSVAIEQRNAEWNLSYRRIKKALPEEYVKALQPYVDEHIALYGAEAQDLRCEKRAAVGSNIKQVMCEKRTY